MAIIALFTGAGPAPKGQLVPLWSVSAFYGVSFVPAVAEMAQQWTVSAPGASGAKLAFGG